MQLINFRKIFCEFFRQRKLSVERVVFRNYLSGNCENFTAEFMAKFARIFRKFVLILDRVQLYGDNCEKSAKLSGDTETLMKTKISSTFVTSAPVYRFRGKLRFAQTKNVFRSTFVC